ncbi:PIN domain-containing protein [Streptomyces sp. NPDC097619]|uniref:PIN domain-containing protein n=1 Tax=Streptomyces sp. NPDC097619 TaxID=3157228 RepID=UPI003327F5D2
MIVLVADTSGLLAALEDGHPGGPGAREALDRASVLIVSPVILSELDHLATRELGRRAAVEAVDDLCRRMRAGRAEAAPVTVSTLEEAQIVRAHYAALDLDLTDAVNVVLARDYDTDAILTLDRRDFRAITPLSPHKAFRVLPDDL